MLGENVEGIWFQLEMGGNGHGSGHHSLLLNPVEWIPNKALCTDSRDKARRPTLPFPLCPNGGRPKQTRSKLGGWRGNTGPLAP